MGRVNSDVRESNATNQETMTLCLIKKKGWVWDSYLKNTVFIKFPNQQNDIHQSITCNDVLPMKA